jgi:hypothetical protein
MKTILGTVRAPINYYKHSIYWESTRAHYWMMARSCMLYPDEEKKPPVHHPSVGNMSDGCPISTIQGILTNQLKIACYMLLQRECFPLERMFPRVGKEKKARIYTDLSAESCSTNNYICSPAPLIHSITTKDKFPLLVLRLTADHHTGNQRQKCVRQAPATGWQIDP